MRQVFATLLLFQVTTLPAQVTDMAFVKKWLLLCDESIAVDSVRAYYIDGRYSADSAVINSRLRAIPTVKLKGIWYSRIKTDNYVPGRGSIYVMSIQKMDTKRVEGWMKEARKLYVDDYVSHQHILPDSKDPVLVIDGQAILATISKETLKKIDPQQIYDISVNGFFPVPSSIYGQNAKNGMVQIWTKDRYEE